MKKTIAIFAFILLGLSLYGPTASANIDTGQLQGVLNGLVAPQTMNESYKTQLADRSGSEEMIDPQSGSLILRQLDLALPGRDGLDLNLARVYESAESEVGDKKVSVSSSSSTSTYHSTQYVVAMLAFDFDEEEFVTVQFGPFSTVDDAWDAAEYILQFQNAEDILFLDYIIFENTTIYYHTTYTVTTRTEAEPNTYSRTRYDLGQGWSLAFPSLQIETESGQNYYYYHDGTGASYRVRFTDSVNGVIEKYPRTDVLFQKDAGTYNNGQVASAFVHTSPEQTKTYFGVDGRLLGVTDILGNEIKFTHINRTINGDSFPYIQQIVDSIGRVVAFTYENTIADPNVEQEHISVSVTHSSEPGEAIELVYTKGKQLIETVINGNIVSSRYEPYLASVTDQGGLTTYYDYYFELEDFDFQQKTLTSPAVAAIYLLKSVQYPHTLTHYVYESAIRNLGPEGAYEAFRVNARRDHDLRYNYNEPDPAQQIYLTGPSNEVTYAYFGDVSGYPTHPSVESLPESYQYGSQATRTLDHLVTTHTYNGKQQLLTQETAAANGEKTVLTNLTFDANFEDKPTKQELKDVTASNQDINKLYVGYEYYDWGGLKSQTQPLTASQYDQEKADYTTTFEFDSVFHKPSKQEWKRDANVTLSERTYYDALGRLSYMIHANGERTDYAYTDDPQAGRTVEVTKDLENGKTARTVVTYGLAANRAFPTSTATYYTDENNQPVVSETAADYDLLYGLMTRSLDENQEETVYQYDDYGRLTKTTLPTYTNGMNETFQMIEHLEYTDRVAAGSEFDPEHHQLLMSSVYGYVTVTKAGDPAVSYDNMVTQYVDGYGNVIRQVRTDGVNQQSIVEQELLYDALKRPVYVKDAQQNTMTAVYDEWGTLVETVDPFGNLNRREYNRETRTHISYLVEQADVAAFRSSPQDAHKKNVLEREVDQWGRLIQQQAYPNWPSQTESVEEAYDYDWTGNLTVYTNPRGYSTSYQYDAMNRLTRITNALQEKTDYAYTILGNLASITQTSADGTQSFTVNDKEYEERGLMVEKTHGSPQDYTYSYNQASLLTDSTDGNATAFAYSYDSLKRTVESSGGDRTYSSHYNYRPFGPYLIQDWRGSSLTGSVAQQFDAYGNVSMRQIVNDGQATISRFRYDTMGRIQSVEHPNAYHSLYTYDKTRIERVQTNGQSLPSSSDSDYAQYEYNPVGTLKKITYPKLDDDSYLTAEYEYDDVNRLLSVENEIGSQVLSTYSYTYDENGNITSVTDDAGITDYTYDPLDRLLTVDYPTGATVQYAYDVRGNRRTENASIATPLQLVETDYTYNVWDQLETVERDGATTSYDYEPQGLRIKKSTETETVRYTYDNNDRVIAEANASFAVQANYVWGPDRLLQKRETSNNEHYYYLHNGHGDVVQIVDRNGQIVNTYDYDEWGNLTYEQETIDNPFKYSGEFYDEETGLYYLRARYYDPSMGRFINKDTYEGELTNPLSLNLYTYVENNPLIYIDPSGMAPVLIGYIYIIEGPYQGDTATYVGSTAQDIKKRMSNHKWKGLVQDPNTIVSAIEVKAELDIETSGKGTYLSARNEALRAAEQEVINKYKDAGAKLENIDSAAAKENSTIWKARHSVEFDVSSSNIALKGGNRVSSAMGIFDFYGSFMAIRQSQYETASYYMQDQGGVFSIGYEKKGWFSSTKYYKTYHSGPSEGSVVNMGKNDYNFWKSEGKALWGYLDGWGNFVPGLFNPKLINYMA